MSHTDHNWRHVPRDRGGTDPLGPWDSTENVGLSYGIRSDGAAADDVLTSDGAGGSLWTPASTLGGGGSLSEVILNSSPDALWKLNETSGSVAADSSGNNWDLGLDTGFVAPTWNQGIGPPGDPAALFLGDTVDDQLSRVASPAFPALSGAFTAAIWVRPNDIRAANDVHYLIGQGSPINSGGVGWTLQIPQGGGGSNNKLELVVNDGSGASTSRLSDNELSVDGASWHFLAVTRSVAGLFTLYVAALAQADTGSDAYSATTGMKIGALNSSNPYQLEGLASYAAIWGRELTGAELLEQYEAADVVGGVKAVHAYHNANQSITNGVTTTLALNSERFDTDGMHDTSTNNSRLTCNTAGKYMIVGNVEFASNATGIRDILIVLNNATTIGQELRGAVSGFVTIISLFAFYDLNPGDYVELRVYQNITGGGALNVLSTSAYSPEFSMFKVS